MEMNDDLRAMARTCYGYGCWSAPYWFLGPEQGMCNENADLQRPVEAWQHSGSRELDDCREFHLRIGVPTTFVLAWARKPRYRRHK